MEFTAKQVADIIHGTIEGNANEVVNKLSKIEEGTSGSLCFLSNHAYIHYIYTSNASVVIVDNTFVAENPITPTLIRVENAYTAFATIIEYYNLLNTKKAGISPLAFVSPSAKIGKNVYIGEFVFVGENAIIGDNVKIFPQCYIGENTAVGENTLLFTGVKIYHSIIVGKNCIFHAGVVIGADGFGFALQTNTDYKKIVHIGNVIVEDNVEMGANTTIDRGTIGSTIIRKGAKLDNLIQIGHNAEIGENTVIVAQTGVAGSTKIGKNCIIAGQVGIAGHLTIADNVTIAAQSGVGSNVLESGITIMGSPAIEIKAYKKSFIHFKHFNSIVQKMQELEETIKELKMQLK